ncbi:Arf GTPase activating protein [Trypanosoma melophagium]|uniref:Arf GTPase activating protein n=1 Tax=Trypanosoma melophagium TaxID=715481 RepID=UPI00351A7BF8|nr:Arf GTPase activating protein [Trypanosoma melophagium]
MSRNRPEHQRRLDNLLRQPENRECCDCSAKQPSWASTNLGVFFCLRCAGLHRAMGTHVSKVKSTTMDTWEEEMIHRCEAIGNARGRLLYEQNLPAHLRPTPSSQNTVVERFIRDKYERKLYYNADYEELLKKFMSDSASGAKSNSTTPTATRAETPTSAISTAGTSVPMLWGGTCTTTAGISSPTSNKNVKSGINMDDLFKTTTATTQSNPYTQPPQQHYQYQQQQQQVPWSNGTVGNTMMHSNNNNNNNNNNNHHHHHSSYSTSPQGNHQTAPVDAKAEIMSLFSSPSTHHSNHVYSAWQPQQSSPGCYLSQ